MSLRMKVLRPKRSCLAWLEGRTLEERCALPQEDGLVRKNKAVHEEHFLSSWPSGDEEERVNKGKERKGKERKGKERKGKERKGKERKGGGKERKGKERRRR